MIMAGTGNPVLASAVSNLFGIERDSDCSILFCNESDIVGADNAPTKRRKTMAGSTHLTEPDVFRVPLPAHAFVLRYVSERFQAQLERWNVLGQQPAALGSSWPSGTGHSRPELRIPLGSKEEVPSALAAIKYAYTGQVSVNTVQEALEVRRQASYLQMKGCTTACDKEIKNLILAGAGPSAGPSGSSGSTCNRVLPPVLQLYAVEHLWPDLEPEDERSFADVLTTAKGQLVSYFGDALAVLNTGSLLEQVLQLPATGLEVLLESGDFGTDTECSVMLLLAKWMAVNYGRTDSEIRKRLCRHVRLVQLSRAYLLHILPFLAHKFETAENTEAGWFPIGVREATFIVDFASANPNQRQMLICSARAAFDLNVGWYDTKPRQQCLNPSGRTFDLLFSRQDLLNKLSRNDAGTYIIFGRFNEPFGSVAAYGFTWLPYLHYIKGQDTCGLVLHCFPHAVYKTLGLLLDDRATLPGTVSLDAVMTIDAWQNGNKGSLQGRFTSSSDIFAVGSRRCAVKVPLKPAAVNNAAGNDGASGVGSGVVSALEAFSDYLADGKFSASLTLLPPSNP